MQSRTFLKRTLYKIDRTLHLASGKKKEKVKEESALGWEMADVTHMERMEKDGSLRLVDGGKHGQIEKGSDYSEAIGSRFCSKVEKNHNYNQSEFRNRQDFDAQRNISHMELGEGRGGCAQCSYLTERQ